MEEKEEAPEEGTAMEKDTATKEKTAKIIRLGLCRHGGLIGPVIRYCMVNKTLESNKQAREAWEEGKEEAPEEETAIEEDTATKEETAKIIRLALCRHAGLIGPVIRYCMVNGTLESNKQSPLIK